MRRLMIIVVALLVSVTLSAQGKPHVNSIALVQDPSSVHFGDTVSFTYTVDKKVDVPGLQVLCYKAGELVLAYGGYPIGAATFTLDSRAWREAGSGEADCVGQLISLQNGHVDKVLASVDFHVQP